MASIQKEMDGMGPTHGVHLKSDGRDGSDPNGTPARG